jgi:hypothetical protein
MARLLSWCVDLMCYCDSAQDDEDLPVACRSCCKACFCCVGFAYSSCCCPCLCFKLSQAWSSERRRTRLRAREKQELERHKRDIARQLDVLLGPDLSSVVWDYLRHDLVGPTHVAMV